MSCLTIQKEFTKLSFFLFIPLKLIIPIFITIVPFFVICILAIDYIEDESVQLLDIFSLHLIFEIEGIEYGFHPEGLHLFIVPSFDVYHQLKNDFYVIVFNTDDPFFADLSHCLLEMSVGC